MAQVPPDLSFGDQPSDELEPSAAEQQLQIEPEKPAESGAAIVTQSVDWSSTAYAIYVKDIGKIPCSALSWEEQAGELATRITAQFPDSLLDDGTRLADLIQLGTNIAVMAAMGTQPFQEVARGIVEEVSPNDGKGGTFEVVAYDPIKATLDSKINKFYEWGHTAKDVVSDVLGEWKVEVGELHPYLDVAFPGPKVYHQQTIADILHDCVNSAMDLSATNDRLVIRSTEGRISISLTGNNQPVYWLRQDKQQDISSVREHLSITDLVTKIVVTGKNLLPEEPGVVGILDSSEQTFGITRQDMIALNKHITIEEAEKQARDMLNQRGQPRHDRSLEAPDVPMLRKYDYVRVTAGTMDDVFSVESVTHSEADRKMSLALATLRSNPTAGDFHDQNPDAIPDEQTTGGSAGGAVLVTGGRVSDSQLYALAKNAGFTGQDAIIAVAISLAEDSSSDPQARNQNAGPPPTTDLGLWQINSQHWGKPGIGTEATLVDPQTNANAAHVIWQDAVNRGANGWQPWSTYPNAYKKYMDRAVAASQAPAESAPSSQAAVTGARAAPNSALISAMNQWVNVPYQMGGQSKAGVDCSGFTQAVYRSVGVNIPRTAAEQWAACQHVSTPQFGDLVFFKGTYGPPDFISHVGIYVGNGQMANAVEPHVKLSDINTAYWKAHLVGFGRPTG